MKTFAQNSFGSANQTYSGFRNVEAKLARLEEILTSETMIIEKKIELSTARIEERFTDMKKQIGMLGLAVAKNQHEAPCDESNRRSEIPVSCHRNYYESNQKVSSKETNDSTETHLSSKTEGFLWAQLWLTKLLLCCAMVLFTMSTITCKPQNKIEYEISESSPVDTMAFIFTDFVPWLFHSVA